MTTSVIDPDFIPLDVSVDDAMIRVKFQSGLELATPVSRFPRLQRATPEQRSVWRLIGKGDGIHWPEADEDISVRGLFSGVRQAPSSAMDEVPLLVGEIYKVAGRLNEMFPGRPFTPDGLLVGRVYNGPFPVELLRNRRDQKNGQIGITVKRLLEMNPSLLPRVERFDSINRWFSPPYSDVA